MLTVMRWVSGRIAFLTTVTALVSLHLIAVTFAAIPPNRLSDAMAPSTGYLQPYFTQNWRLFAPNPVSEDRTLRFQVAYRDEAGDVQNSKWIAWTDVELDLIRHRLVGGRGGYVTNKLIESLGSVYRPLTQDQRSIANTSRDDAPLSWTNLADQLERAGLAPAQRSSFLRYERAAVRLATDVAASRHEVQDVVAVRYSILLEPVTPYSARGGTADERDAARPNSADRLSGWRVPLTSSASERRSIADFDERHR